MADVIRLDGPSPGSDVVPSPLGWPTTQMSVPEVGLRCTKSSSRALRGHLSGGDLTELSLVACDGRAQLK